MRYPHLSSSLTLGQKHLPLPQIHLRCQTPQIPVDLLSPCHSHHRQVQTIQSQNSWKRGLHHVGTSEHSHIRLCRLLDEGATIIKVALSICIKDVEGSKQ